MLHAALRAELRDKLSAVLTRLEFAAEHDAEFFAALPATPGGVCAARQRGRRRALREQNRQPAPPSAAAAWRRPKDAG